VDPSKGSYAKEWAQWEQRLRVTLFGNADYLNAIQVTIFLDNSIIIHILLLLNAIDSNVLPVVPTANLEILYSLIRGSFLYAFYSCDARIIRLLERLFVQSILHSEIETLFSNAKVSF
jgi:hypothetical protein